MTLDNTQNSIQTVTEERIRQLVALFPGKGEIKNTILKGLQMYGYPEGEAKKLYNFIENLKHMLPESPKYKPESTIKKNISLLIMLAEVMPEVQVALFGGSTEACLARLAASVVFPVLSVPISSTFFTKYGRT